MAFSDRHADYGQRWGEGAARCFSIEGDFLDDAQGLRLMPVPDSFFCPISAAIMNDPVATVDGCSYEREYIERWFRERRQFRQPITSPTTGLELQSTTLMPLMALQRAIEAYLLHRPELKRDHLAGRSFEEAAQVLQIDLLEKQAMNSSVHEELCRLREANRALKRALRETEAACKKVMQDLEQTRSRVRELEDEKSASMNESVRAINAEACQLPADSALSDKPPSPTYTANELSSLPSESEPAPEVETWKPTPCVQRPKIEKRGMERERRRPVAKVETAMKLPQATNDRVANDRVQQLLQGALIAALIALCLFLHFRSPAGIKVHSKFSGTVHEFDKSGDGKVSWHVEQLQSGMADERMFAALALQKIATEGVEGQAAIIEAGATERLVKLLEDNVVWVQEASASTLSTLAASSTKSQAAVARAGAISPLVKLLKAVDVDVLPKTAASALRHIAAGDERNQVAIVRAGAIAPLVEIMKSEWPAARLEAAMALREIATEGRAENRYAKQVAIAQAGAIVPLVRLIRDESSGARQAAAGTLRILATNNADYQVAIAQAGAIGPLVELLRDAEPGARLEAAAALDHLAVVEEETNFGNQVAIGQAGAIAGLSQLLEDTVPEVAFAAAGALRSLAAGNADNLDRVVQAGCISGLVMLMKQDNVAAPAVALLRYLASSEAGNRADIPWVSAIGPLTKLLEHEAPQIRRDAASALASLTRGNSDIQDAILQAGVSSDLLKGEQLS